MQAKHQNMEYDSDIQYNVDDEDVRYILYIIQTYYI